MSTDQIKSAVNIIDVVGEFVRLNKRGVNYIGCCPFHNEKTPSFTVSPAKNSFKCFGCGKGGDAITFLQEHEAYTYGEALNWLGKKYNIEPDKFNADNANSAEQSENESLRVICSAVTRFYVDNLDEKAKNYLINDRGFTPETIEFWKIGYNPNEWQALTDYAQKQSLNIKQLLQIGYLGKGEKNGNIYDRLKGRIIFPVMDMAGNIIGFNARVCGKVSENEAKYINSNNNSLFNKSKVLFGLYQAKTAIQKADKCILVEGPTDVISLHQTGIKNVVASNGTALTIDQLKLIQRFTSHLVIMTDGDIAGKKATMHDISMALQLNFRVDIIPLSNSDDPDNIARRLSFEQIQTEYINRAVDFIDYTINELKHKELSGAIQRTETIKTLVEHISNVTDTITRDSYIKNIASRMGIAENLLCPEVVRLRKKLEKQVEANTETEKEAFWPYIDALDSIIKYKSVNLHESKQRALDEILSGTENSLAILKLPTETEVDKLVKQTKKINYKPDLPMLFANMEYNYIIETLKMLFVKGVDIYTNNTDIINEQTGDVIISGESFYDYYIETIIKSVDKANIKHIDIAIEKVASITSHLTDNQRAVKLEWIKDRFKYYNLRLDMSVLKKRINGYLKRNEKKDSQHFTIGNQNSFGLTDKQTDDLYKYKLYYKDNRIFFDSPTGVRPYSNFVIEPILHTISTNNNQKVFKLININNREALISVTTKEMNNLGLFRCAIEDKGNFVFDGGLNHLTLLKSYLYDRTTYANEIEIYGWHRDGFWAWSNGLYHIDNTQILADEYGIIKTQTREGEEKTYYIKPASKQYRNDHTVFVQQKKFRIKEGTLDFNTWASQLIKVYEKKAMLTICALFTTIFSDYIFAQLGNLPLIDLFGPKGTGKTEHAKSILSIFGERQEEINLTKVTPFAASHSLSMFSNAFVIFDEYKNNLGSTWIEFLKSIYNRQGRVKGNFKEGNEIMTVPVNSMVFVCGQEMLTADIAAFSRCVFLSTYKTTHTPDETKDYNLLKEMDDEPKTHFVKKLIQLRPLIEEQYSKQFFKLQKDITNELTIDADDRVIRNYATLLATFAVIEKHINCPFTLEEAKKVAHNCIKEQMNIMNDSSEIGQFWQTFVFLVDTMKIQRDYNFIIDTKPEIKLIVKRDDTVVEETISFIGCPNFSKKLLFLRWDGIYNHFAESAARARGEIMSDKSLLHYLEHSKAYMGKAKSVRFKNSVNQAWVFDYDLLGVKLDSNEEEITQNPTSNLPNISQSSLQFNDTETEIPF